MASKIYIIFLIIHVLWHVVATLGVAIGILKGYRMETPSKWRIASALTWLAISVIMSFHMLMDFQK